MNMTATNVDAGRKVVLQSGPFRDDTFEATAAKEYPAGTIVARDSVSGRLVPFVAGGTTNENGIPKGALVHAVDASGGTGNFQIRLMESGCLRFQDLIIDADGNNSNVDAAVIDQLRDYGLAVKDVTETNIQDNQ